MTPAAMDLNHRPAEPDLDAVVDGRRNMKRPRGDRRPEDRPAEIPQPSHHSRQPYDRYRLPSGWLDCPSSGREIGCFVPSKVPLSEAFDESVPPGKRYSFKQVIHQQRALGRRLGLVIDLTNTARYYSTSVLKEEGIKYVKIACVGKDAAPSHAQVNEFVHEVSQFLSNQRQSEKRHVLVHCTHGHNRTGYMIVHYLMRSRSMSVAEAIRQFAEVRPPGIYKAEYIEELYKYYHEMKPEFAVCPPTPEWKRSPDRNCDAMPNGDDDDGNLGSAPALGNIDHETEARMTNDDVLGDDIPRDQAEGFRHFCYQTLNLGAGQRGGKMQFPGSHPVSLNRENLRLLREHSYFATWKADGTRYMMLLTVDGCYLIDRRFNIRRVQLRFPCRTSGGFGEKTHHYTLLDGEMIIDTVPGSQKQERRYLIYDLMAINQFPVVDRPFHERWKMIEDEVILPRNSERGNISRSRIPHYRYDLEPFRVRRKNFWLLSTVIKLLKEFIPNLPHEADGLIFQGRNDPYVPRTHEGLLKWKYPEMNSVDFLFEVDRNGYENIFLNRRGVKERLERNNRVVFEAGEDPSTYSGKIIECSWDFHRRVWVCMRTRVDKSTPNEFNTFQKVMRSIKDNITEDVLLNEINGIRDE